MEQPNPEPHTESNDLPSDTAPAQTGPSPLHHAIPAAHRPPNAFVLYSQASRSAVQLDNPTLSNIEISRLLGKLWKEMPADQKLPFKQSAAGLQEVFKREHPDYAYRKARMKRTLSEMLAKNGQRLNPMFMHGNQNKMAMPRPGLAPQGMMPPLFFPPGAYPLMAVGFPGFPQGQQQGGPPPEDIQGIKPSSKP
jgi:transcription factor SOX7/8/10/18 (SOX group E/F)